MKNGELTINDKSFYEGFAGFIEHNGIIYDKEHDMYLDYDYLQADFACDYDPDIIRMHNMIALDADSSHAMQNHAWKKLQRSKKFRITMYGEPKSNLRHKHYSVYKKNKHRKMRQLSRNLMLDNTELKQLCKVLNDKDILTA